jgi:toxin-antitoxin system PIN domain toxin
VDTNILVYAHREDVSWFPKASAAVALLAEGGEPWAIPWPCIHEFLAIVTHPRVFVTPTPLESAVGQVSAWLESPSLALLREGPGYWDRLADVVLGSGAGGPLVHDARVAAICLANGVSELWSADRDFNRFPALRVRNPLVAR